MDNKEILKIVAKILRNVDSLKWKCLYPNCNEIAINSHLLQKNGILNYLAEDGHLYEIRGNDLFKIEKEGALISKRVGINKAISQPLFCNQHDTKIFREIETSPINFFDPRVQLLFSYRSLCSELRKKQKGIESFKRQAQSRILQMYTSNISEAYGKHTLKGFEIGAADLEKLKLDFEKAISENEYANFEIKTYAFDLIKICASALFSPIQPDGKALKKAWEQEQPLNTIFINVIPQEKNLIIIVGYHKKFKDDWIIKYVNSWKGLNAYQLQQQLTDLISSRVETWSVAPSLYENIPKPIIKKFEKYWNSNSLNLSATQVIDFNLFDGIV